MTCVHIPHTSHPKAALIRTVDRAVPVYQQVAITTAGGESMFSRRRPRVLATCLVASGVDGERRPTKLNGAQSKPTINASEKFNVARVERKSPRRRSEKDFVSKYC
jgi:hypothetical protein